MPFRHVRAESNDHSPKRSLSIDSIVAAGESLTAALERRLQQGRPFTIEEIGILAAHYDEYTEFLKAAIALSQPETTSKNPDHFSVRAFAPMPKMIRNRDMQSYWRWFRRLFIVTNGDLRYALACQWQRGQYGQMFRCSGLTVMGICLLLWGGCLAMVGFRKANITNALRLIQKALNPVQVMPSTSPDYC